MIKELMQVLLILLIVTCSITSLILFAFYSSGRYKCNSFGKMSGHQVMWVFADDCYVKVNGRYIKYDEYQARAVAKDGLRELAHGHD